MFLAARQQANGMRNVPSEPWSGGKKRKLHEEKFFWIQVVFGFIVVATAVQPLQDDEGLKVQYCTKVDFHVS